MQGGPGPGGPGPPPPLAHTPQAFGRAAPATNSIMRASLPPPTQQPQTLDPEALLEEKVSSALLLVLAFAWVI